MRLHLLLAAAAAGPRPALIATSVVGWAALIGSSQAFAIAGYCGAATGDWDLSAWREVRWALQGNPVGGLVLHWVLMLLAMMLPLLAEPLSHLWWRSLARRRPRALTAFLVAYFGVWILAGIPLTLTGIAFRGLPSSDWMSPAFAVIAIALSWQLVPAKQICLNRCHRLPCLAAFGFAADRDCLRYGFVTGLWCLGSCWALMLVPLVIDSWHVAVMMAVSIVLVAERQARPRPAHWGLLRPAL